MHRGPAGVGEQGMQALGSFRNLGDPIVSAQRVRVGKPETNPQVHVGWRSLRHGSEEASAGRYPRVKKETRGEER